MATVKVYRSPLGAVEIHVNFREQLFDRQVRGHESIQLDPEDVPKLVKELKRTGVI